MNLESKHFPLILLGGAIGSGFGWLAAFMFNPRILPDGSPIGLHGAGAMFGAIAGVGFAVVAIVARAGRDPKVGPARYFMRINGMGSTLVGRSELHNDGSYVTTEWFTILWVPVFPVCRYRVTKHQEASTSTPYTIHEKLPVRLNDAARVYGVTLLILLGIAGLAFLLLK